MKPVSIETLLSWAFIEELPKIGAGSISVPGFSATDALAGLMELGTGIDKTPNVYGVVSGYVLAGEPHPDAVLVGDAVRAIGRGEGIEIGAGWTPFPEWDDPHGLIAAAVEKVRQRETGRIGKMSARGVVNLLVNCAILRRRPDWEAEEPKTAMVMKSGKPAWFIQASYPDSLGNMRQAEEDGYDRRKHRPKSGAYRKYRLTSSIDAAILDRMEWQIWQSALASLHMAVHAKLTSHSLYPFYPDFQPWYRMAVAEGKIVA